jgi:cytochrome c oxidase subunit 3
VSGTQALPGAPAPARRPAENGVFGMALFVFVEVMMFAGMISAYLIVELSAMPGLWPPPDQPRLPVERTLVNTAALLASGVTMFAARRAFGRGARTAARWLLATILLGGFFVAAQGVEWAALLRQGLTLTSSQLGAFFYLIVGAHAAHAIAAIATLASCWPALRAGRLTSSRFGAAQIFWYFVVLVWPLLYWLVYL